MFQVILVSSSLSDRDQSLFLSVDEGATFQKQPIPFFMDTLIFHPKEEDKVLAYTKESKVSCMDASRLTCGAGVCLTHLEASAHVERTRNPWAGCRGASRGWGLGCRTPPLPSP